VRLIVLLISFAMLAGCAASRPHAIAPAPAGSCRSTEIHWMSPADPRQRTRLDAWCAGVGAAVHVNSSSNAPTEIAMDRMTFVSWNVHVGGGDIRAFVKDLASGAHTEGRAVGDYVLMLQEAVRTDAVPPLAPEASGAARIAPHHSAHESDIVALSRELGLSLIYVPSMRNGDEPDDPAEDRGNAILSTLPLSEPIGIELPGERQRRVVIVAKVATVSVAVIHLDAFGGARRLLAFWTPWMRDAQVRSTASALPDGPLVIGGDLNTWHGRDELAARFLARQVATPLTIDRAGLGLRVLDYMFFRAAPSQHARYHQVENLYGSDHRPLVGWVE
jgi:hypothetical protein